MLVRWLAGVALIAVPVAAPAESGTRPMRAFGSYAELAAFLKARQAPVTRRKVGDVAPPVLSIPAPAPEAAVVVTGSRQSITNTQEAGIDEGGIVKQHGNHLVILRRGRLFTVAVGDRQLRPVDRINAYPPRSDGEGWYDELLIAGDQAVVIGYSYAREATEINRFPIGRDGRLRYLDTHHLRSNDYYSASNYASRLNGERLIFYTPLRLRGLEGLPALRRWTGGRNDSWRPISSAASVYAPEPLRTDKALAADSLHTVTICDLARLRFQCRATSVLGGWSRSFYVSGDAAYVFTADAVPGRRGEAARGMIYRLPLNGGRPGAVQNWGAPVDQFSFREERGRLRVLVRAGGRGDGMWRSLVSEGEAALLTVPLTRFGDGSAVLVPAAYRPLPLDNASGWNFHNRFVGNHLIYAAGEFAGERPVMSAYAVPLSGAPIARLSVPHGIDRIEVMGRDAVVIGNDTREQLGFTDIVLGGKEPVAGTSFLLPAAQESESRSHAFFYRPDPASPDGASGC